MMNKSVVLFLISVLLGHSVLCQTDSTSNIELKEVVLKTTRITIPEIKQPLSIFTYEAETLQETRQQLSLQEYISQTPGLFSLNANNYAQDLRISIRGFGARSAFGIRGVKIIVDGIPETTPDGQGQLDNLNLSSIRIIEVLRGPSSALYGNASGGVINICTQEDIETDYAEVGFTTGSFQFQQYQFGAGIKNERSKYIFNGAHILTEGYREQSGLTNTNLNLRSFHNLSSRSKLNFQFNYTNSPRGEDAGGLTSELVKEDRTQAFQRNALFKTGESIEHIKLGSSYSLKLNSTNEFNFFGYYSYRGFEGRIPVTSSGWIDLDRNYLGQGGNYSWKSNILDGDNSIQVGYEFASQRDRRMRYQNNEGERGALALSQVERFTSFGAYALDYYTRGKWSFLLGVRFDVNRLSINDRKLDNGNQSGLIDLNAFNPTFGANYKIWKELFLYGSFRTSFETPSLSELSANPLGEQGFNSKLKPQKASNYELGIKGNLGVKMNFSFTLFHIDTTDDLVPFEIENEPGRTYYRNAGSTTRDGIETFANYKFTENFSMSGSYTFSQFIYDSFIIDGEDLGGNFLPGIPKHILSIQANYESKSGLNARVQHRYNDVFFATDANDLDASEGANHILDLSLGYRITFGKSQLVPFFGINNLLDSDYSDNVRINAFGGRYFEPAAGINFYGGLRWKFSRESN